jgi:hypothetical protein
MNKLILDYPNGMSIEQYFGNDNSPFNAELEGYKNVKNAFETEKMYPTVEDIDAAYSNRLKDIGYGAFDLRSLKLSNISQGLMNNISMRVGNSTKLITDCSQEIAEAQNQLIKNFKLFVPNKAYNLDPGKWWLIPVNGAKYIIFGKTIALDIDENFYFKEIGLENEKDRADKLALVKEFHDARKSGVGARIDYAIVSLKENWYRYLYEKNLDLVRAAAHSIYWNPIALELMTIHDLYFGTVPAADWFLYPFYFQIRHNFSVAIPDKALFCGPPINLFKKPPFPGKMLAEIGLFIQYTNSFFGGKITLTRHGKSY